MNIIFCEVLLLLFIVFYDHHQFWLFTVNHQPIDNVVHKAQTWLIMMVNSYSTSLVNPKMIMVYNGRANYFRIFF